MSKILEEQKKELDERALAKAGELAELLDKAVNICLEMDTPDCEGKVLGSKVCFSDAMGLYAGMIMNSVLSNIAIHKGHVKSAKDAQKAGAVIGKAMLEAYGFDAKEVAHGLLDQQVPEKDGRDKE